MDEWLDKLAGGPATYSKHPQRYAQGALDWRVFGGQDAYCFLPGGRALLDTVAGLGAVFLGHANREVNKAVHRTVAEGACFSLSHVLEAEVAEMLVNFIPCAEQVRFCVNGSDATNAAVRLARAYTNKREILVSGYSGFADWYIASTSHNHGILEANTRYTTQFQWSRDSLDYAVLRVTGIRPPRMTCVSDDLAAIIVEVPPLSWGTPNSDYTAFLQYCKDTAEKYGALFILDETVTGIRYGLGGAQERYGVTPHLACFGKALANGYPLAAVAGPRDLMHLFEDGYVFCSSTFAGWPPALAAAKAVLQYLVADYNAHYTAIHQVGTEWGAMGSSYSTRTNLFGLLGTSERMVFRWHEPACKTYWIREMERMGVLVGGPTFPMTCYRTEDSDLFVNAAISVIEQIESLWQNGGIALIERELGGIPIAPDVFGTRYARSES